MNREAAEKRGRGAETLGCWWLRLHGWRILARRARVPGGEVDIVARRRNVLAFIEVKARSTSEAAAMALDAWRLRRVVAAADPGRVRSLAFSRDGGLLAAGLLRGEALLLDADSLEVRGRLSGHPLAVAALAFSPDGSRLATASSDGIRLWDTATCRLVLFLMTPDNPVLSLAWSHDGKWLASGHGKSLESPSFVRLWEGR